ncbi:RNA polymerase sigma factor [Paraconexibacter sp. AEG42_29]|uniref:RNA polymerase sigma factor n=1 Tax=Paraconexibacter sp. AEG42_29 TaxID=2997339 RepID=A0AAU7AWG0_9ACTN
MRGDEELLRGAAGGDADAFAEFYRRLLPVIVTYIRRRVDTPELAFDVTAETFAAVAANVGDFDPGRGSARGWVFAIAQNELRQAWRRGQVEDRARRRLAYEPIELDDDALDRVENLVDDGALMAALAELPQKERAAVSAHVIEERGYSEIAAELRCSESVVRKRVSRGLRRLRDLVEERP